MSARAVLALCTLACAPSTAACADGTLPADEVEAPEPGLPPEPAALDPLAPDAPVPEPEPEPPPVALDEPVVWLGAVVVGVPAAGVGVAEDDVVVVAGDVGVVLEVVVGVVVEVLAEGVVVTSETNSVLPAPAGSSDALVVEELLCAEVS